MSDTRDPATDQQLPEEGKEPIHQLVIDSLKAWGVEEPGRYAIERGLAARRELGVRKYGKPLQSHNGRDALQDAWEEVLDSLVYLCQMELEGWFVGDLILATVQIADRLARLKIERGDVEVR